MGWKQNLLGNINSAIRQKQDAVFAVYNAEQQAFGERMLENIFSTLHVNKLLKLDFKIIPIADQDKISVGDILEHKGNDDKPGERVFHEEYGTGEIKLYTYIGPKPVFYIKFDSLEDEIIINRDDLRLRPKDENKSTSESDETKRKLAHAKELERIQADALKEAEEIKNMNNETLVNEFEQLIRNGAGHGYRRVVFMKKEFMRRLDRGDHL